VNPLQNPSEQKAIAIQEFRKLIGCMESADNQQISNVNLWASYYHALAAPEFTKIVTDFIQQVSKRAI
jgi:hypothetical protein